MANRVARRGHVVSAFYVNLKEIEASVNISLQDKASRSPPPVPIIEKWLFFSINGVHSNASFPRLLLRLVLLPRHVDNLLPWV